jgi:hypothetical protein
MQQQHGEAIMFKSVNGQHALGHTPANKKHILCRNCYLSVYKFIFYTSPNWSPDPFVPFFNTHLFHSTWNQTRHLKFGTQEGHMSVGT